MVHWMKNPLSSVPDQHSAKHYDTLTVSSYLSSLLSRSFFSPAFSSTEVKDKGIWEARRSDPARTEVVRGDQPTWDQCGSVWEFVNRTETSDNSEQNTGKWFYSHNFSSVIINSQVRRKSDLSQEEKSSPVYKELVEFCDDETLILSDIILLSLTTLDYFGIHLISYSVLIAFGSITKRLISKFDI